MNWIRFISLTDNTWQNFIDYEAMKFGLRLSWLDAWLHVPYASAWYPSLLGSETIKCMQKVSADTWLLLYFSLLTATGKVQIEIRRSIAVGLKTELCNPKKNRKLNVTMNVFIKIAILRPKIQ